MAEKKPGNLMVSPQGGMLRDLVMRLKLIVKLIGDRRINPFIKLIPIGALIYLISPIDLAPGLALPVIGALDDAAIVWLGSYLFVEFCPPEIVKEHMKSLSSNIDIVEGNDEIVDAEATDLGEDKKE